MPEIIMVAGPNGAGKTSFANSYLPAAREGLFYINADEIARRLSARVDPTVAVEITAARAMLGIIGELVERRVEFMLETTLATLVYASRIPSWQAAGYTVSLIYLRLPSVEASIARVERRVRAGGHSIPEVTIRRRFTRSLDYLERICKPIVDDWYIWDSIEGDFRLQSTSDDP